MRKFTNKQIIAGLQFTEHARHVHGIYILGDNAVTSVLYNIFLRCCPYSQEIPPGTMTLPERLDYELKIKSQ